MLAQSHVGSTNQAQRIVSSPGSACGFGDMLRIGPGNKIMTKNLMRIELATTAGRFGDVDLQAMTPQTKHELLERYWQQLNRANEDDIVPQNDNYFDKKMFHPGQ